MFTSLTVLIREFYWKEKHVLCVKLFVLWNIRDCLSGKRFEELRWWYIVDNAFLIKYFWRDWDSLY